MKMTGMHLLMKQMLLFSVMAHLGNTQSENERDLIIKIVTPATAAALLLCICACAICCSLQLKCRGRILMRSRKRKRDGEVVLEEVTREDGTPPPPIPPHTMEMYILPVGNSTSTTSTEGVPIAADSGTNDDGAIGDGAVVTDSVFDDDSGSGPLTGTIACQNAIIFTATVERGSCTSLDTPPRTYPRAIHSSRDYVNVISNQDDSTRREFVIQQVVVKENTEGAILVQNEALAEEGCCGTFNDATSQTSIDIGFPPPIPPQTPAMFLVQTCEPTDHNTIHIPMRTNLSYNELGSGTVQD